jgi:hypothetical protein
MRDQPIRCIVDMIDRSGISYLARLAMLVPSKKIITLSYHTITWYSMNQQEQHVFQYIGYEPRSE